ncbi:MAG: serine/threonine protein kinase, partial [Sandaracinaceae bacterium]|nr:serine/threonine protein kinase [Sandaracinaceae bacterium]
MHAAQARTLGPYELLEPIGEGGFARVHHARKDGRSFAIKILSPSVRDAQTESRFAREVAALGALKHPNLIELCDHGVDPVHGPYLVMPLVSGMSLRDLARGGAGGIAPEAALLLIEPVLRALSVLHAASLVHRDVKPENVLVTPLGEVIVVDLGLALHEAHSRLTEAGTITGSVPYMSPEQIEGRSITAASDLWSIGVVLYELITGRRPFARERPSEELASILASSFEPLDAADRRVGPELAAFVARCLSRNAQDRFRDAASALEELSACFDWITPRELRAERTKVVTDPRGYAGHVAPKRAALLVSEAKEMLRGGDPFGALRVLDRALAYAPSDPEVLALVDRASEGRSLPPEPAREPPEDPGARSIGEVDTLPAKSLARTLRLLVSAPSKRRAPPK